MTLDHLNTVPTPPGPPPEDAPPEVPGGGTPEKKRLPRLLLTVGAVLLAVVALAVFFLTRPAISDPYAAASQALESLPALPEPATLGVLGQGEVEGTRFGVSGNLNLQADDHGLALSLTDFTIGYEEGSVDLEVYINKDAAALRLPGVLGEEWYGINFMEGLKVQAVKAVDEELVDWYFSAEQLEEVKWAIYDLRTALEGVHDLRFSSEVTELKGLLAHAPATVEKVDGGFILTFDKTAQSDKVVPPVILRLDAQKRLTALEFGFKPGGHCLLDLGDAEEPSPRLELTWGEDGVNSLELAFTISEGKPVETPSYTNAFSLLSVLAAMEE